MAILLTTAFLPPLEYVAAIAEGMVLSRDRVVPSAVYLEAFENYQKQSWRNRCRILGPRGREDWSFPIVHRNGSHNGIPITELEIDWSGDWLHRFKGALETAYGSSAFFEYYYDGLRDILDSRPSMLWDLNLLCLEWLLSALGVPAELGSSISYGRCPVENVLDLRTAFHPKRENDYLACHGLGRPYFQVFSPRFGFTAGLSAVDLLFNEGPASITYLL